MSQHKFRAETTTSQLVEVQLGWDKPKQRFYCVISPVIQEGAFKGELDDPLYSNLFEESPSTLTLNYFIEVCRNYGVTVTSSIVDLVEQDRVNNTVNISTDYRH